MQSHIQTDYQLFTILKNVIANSPEKYYHDKIIAFS